MKTKKCSQCGDMKPLEQFKISKKSHTGRGSWCKQCHNISSANRYYHKRYGEDPCVIKAIVASKISSTTKTCKRCGIEKHKKQFVKRKQSVDGYRNICCDCHFKEQRVREKAWRDTNPNYKLSKYMSNKVWHCLKGLKNGQSWRNLVSYTLQELKQHLESKFQDGMSWDNYGQWHIDHITPVSRFNITSVNCDDFRKCWALENLQPLWAHDNWHKYNKLLEVV